MVFWLGLRQSETRPLGGQCLLEPRQSHSCDRKPWWLWCETTLPMEKNKSYCSCLVLGFSMNGCSKYLKVSPWLWIAWAYQSDSAWNRHLIWIVSRVIRQNRIEEVVWQTVCSEKYTVTIPGKCNTRAITIGFRILKFFWISSLGWL